MSNILQSLDVVVPFYKRVEFRGQIGKVTVKVQEWTVSDVAR